MGGIDIDTVRMSDNGTIHGVTKKTVVSVSGPGLQYRDGYTVRMSGTGQQ